MLQKKSVSIFVFLLLFIILFNNCLSNYFNVFSYSDEFITMVLLFLALIKVKNNPSLLTQLLDKNTNEFKGLVCIFCFLFVGLVSTLVFDYEITSVAIFKDAFSFLKFFICYYSSLIVFRKSIVFPFLFKIIKIVIVSLFILSIISQFIDLGMTHDVRMGINSFKFLFSHPTFLVFTLVVLFCLIHLTDSPLKYEILIFFTIFMTQRTKGFLFIFGAVAFLLALKRFKQIKLKHVLIFGTISILLSAKKIMTYISAAQFSARPLMYITAFQLMIHYFPFGTGFASFGTYNSAKYYSPIYYRYNLDFIEGLKPDSYGYIGDSFWPGVIGQFGLIGFISYIFSLYYVFLSSVSHSENKVYESQINMWVYVFLALFVETTLTNESGAFIAVLLILLKRVKCKY